jgi:phosphoribosyl-ATP pyrophosphohydrolase
MSEQIKPFIILTDGGKVANMVQTNPKGYRKSIENDTIWAVNPETGRLLPHDENYNIKGFSERGGWYEVLVAGTADSESPKSGNDEGNIAASETDNSSDVIESLFAVIEQRRKDLPEGSYTTHLFNSGLSKIKKKTGEEAVELLLAETRDETVYESADLIYHMLVLLSASGISPREIFAELKNRE